jgi:chemotaxis protein histidine kinase CheA
VNGVSGATILGDGSVALILDVQQLVNDEEQSERIKISSEAEYTEKRNAYA